MWFRAGGGGRVARMSDILLGGESLGFGGRSQGGENRRGGDA